MNRGELLDKLDMIHKHYPHVIVPEDTSVEGLQKIYDDAVEDLHSRNHHLRYIMMSKVKELICHGYHINPNNYESIVGEMEEDILRFLSNRIPYLCQMMSGSS